MRQLRRSPIPPFLPPSLPPFRYLQFYAEYTDNCRKDVKIKSKRPLLAFLAHTKAYIHQLQDNLSISSSSSSSPSSPSSSSASPSPSLPAEPPDLDLLYKLHQIRDVLERSKIAGFNRKLQLKVGLPSLPPSLPPC